MTQIQYADDAFDLGPASVGTRLSDWVGCLPDSGAYNRGWLIDGHSTAAGAQGVQGAVASVVPINGTSTAKRAWVYRREFAGSVRTAASFFLLPQAGSPEYPFLFVIEYGVFGRYQGGTLSNTGTTDVHFLNGSCYLGRIRQNLASFQMFFEIVKVTTGTQAVLNSVAFTISDQAQVDWLKPFELILDISGTSTVSLDLRVKNVDTTGGFELGETSVVTASDSTSPISGDGRSGFTMGGPRTQTIFAYTASVIDVCEWFEVSDQADPNSVYFRDEWERLGPNYSETHGPDLFSVSGNNLQGGYSSDQFANTATTTNGTGAIKLIYNAAGEHVRFVGSGSGFDQCVSISQRPAGDSRYQHRSVTANLANTGGGRQYAGILLRGSWTDPVYAASPSTVRTVPTLKGYLALAQYYPTTSTYNVGVYRYSGSAAGVPLQMADLSTASALWTAGADFTLDFDIYPIDGAPDPNNAPTEMVVKINGTQVVLLDVGANGIAVSAGGTVTDSSSGNIPQGSGEGFVMLHNASSTTVQIDDWTEQALHVSADTPPEDQLSIAVQGEGSAVGTINDILEPEFAVSVDYAIQANKLPFESGHVYAESNHVGTDGLPDPRRTFTFTKRASTPTEHHALERFFDDHEGIEGAFNYTDRIGNTIKVCYVDDSLTRTQVGPTVYGTTFQLVELF